MAVKVGDPAPSFKLFDTDKQEIALSNLRGKNVVLLFFPLAFTSVCTAELCSVRDNLSRFNKLNAQVLAVSVDSIFTLRKFKQEQGLNFALLSDFNREVAQSFGALYENFVLGMKNVAKRSAFVIDKDGVIRYAEILDKAGDLPNFEVIEHTLAQLN
jgi:peroxiredoxin